MGCLAQNWATIRLLLDIYPGRRRPRSAEPGRTIRCPSDRDTVCVLFVRPEFRDLGRIVRSPIPSLPDYGGGLCFPAPDRTHRSIAREAAVTFCASCPRPQACGLVGAIP